MLYRKNAQPTLSPDLFRNPTSEYRGAPFWAWNCHLEKDELLRQLDVLREMGFGGAHMHVRTGMDTPYLSEEFFSLVCACTEKCKKEGMLAWLYDEDRWPSGAAGGLVTKDKRYRIRYLLFTKTPYREGESEMHDSSLSASAQSFRSGNGYLIARYRVTLNERGEMTDYRRLSDDEDGNGAWYAYIETPTDNPWFNFQTYLNTMDKTSVARFIEVTHENYKKHLQAEFGGTVPAIFTDEPQFALKEALPFADSENDLTLPFTDDLDDTFKATYGVSLLDHLPELIWDLETGVSVIRYQYHDHAAERFASAFADQVGAWCRENGILLTGHMMNEPTLKSQTKAIGEAMRSYRSFGFPGIDMLCARFEFTTAKQAQSAVHQYGYEGMLSELYGVTGWDFDFRGHKLHGDWQAALGVTLRVPHLSWVSMKGSAKRDYPASINYQSPWYKEYRYVEDHFARVNTALTRGKPIVRVGVIHPVESYWLHWGPAEQTALIREKLDGQFKDLTEWLLFGGIDFDFISESLLPSLCPCGDAPFRVGEMSYDVVIVPGCETLRSSTLDRLEQYADKGGRLIFLGDAPLYENAIPSERGIALFARSETIGFNRCDLLTALEDEREIELRSQSGALTDRFVTQLRQDGDARWLFVAPAREPYNKDVPNSDTVTIKMRGSFVPTLYDTLSGTIAPIPYEIKNGRTIVRRRFYDYDSLLLRFDPTQSDAARSADVSPARAPRRLVIPERVGYSLSEPNVLVLDRAEYSLDGGEFRPVTEILRIDTVCRRELGWLRGSDWAALRETAQPYVLPPEVPKHIVTLRYDVESQIELDGAELALESPEVTTVEWNGVPIERNPEGFYVDHAIQCLPLPGIKRGKNVLVLTVPYSKRIFLERCYLLGQFGVALSGSSASLVALPDSVGFDDLTRCGFPFYSGEFRYQIPIRSDGGETTVHVPHYRGAVMTVSLDGEKRGVIAYPPYTLPIGQVAPGEHTLTVDLFVSRHNGFGSIHNADEKHSWEGPDAWRTEGDRWTESYRLKREGVLSAPVVTEE